MTNVLPFRLAQGPSADPAAFPPGHSAAILFFTGVRYERDAAAPEDLGRDDNASPRRRKARRRA